MTRPHEKEVWSRCSQVLLIDILMSDILISSYANTHKTKRATFTVN